MRARRTALPPAPQIGQRAQSRSAHARAGVAPSSPSSAAPSTRLRASPSWYTWPGRERPIGSFAGAVFRETVLTVPTRRLGHTLAAILYIVLWASAFVPSRIVSASAPPLWILVLRFL